MPKEKNRYFLYSLPTYQVCFYLLRDRQCRANHCAWRLLEKLIKTVKMHRRSVHKWLIRAATQGHEKKFNFCLMLTNDLTGDRRMHWKMMKPALEIQTAPEKKADFWFKKKAVMSNSLFSCFCRRPCKIYLGKYFNVLMFLSMHDSDNLDRKKTFFSMTLQVK